MKRWWLALVMFIGCEAYTSHLPVPTEKVASVYVKTPSPDWMPDCVEQATGEWNRALNGHVQLIDTGPIESTDKIDPEGSIIVESVPHDSPMILGTHVRNTVAATWPWGHKRPSSIIYVATDLADQIMCKSLIMHEFGHVMGANDTFDGDLMNIRLVHSDCVDKSTMIQISNVWHWNLDSTNYCH